MVETKEEAVEVEPGGGVASTRGEEGGGIPYKVKAGAFLAFAGGFGLLAGFGGALAQVLFWSGLIKNKIMIVFPSLSIISNITQK